MWLAKQHDWANDLRSVTNRDVQLKLIVSGALGESDIGANAVTIAELSWRDCWESHANA